jgi:hypothetical protein
MGGGRLKERARLGVGRIERRSPEAVSLWLCLVISVSVAPAHADIDAPTDRETPAASPRSGSVVLARAETRERRRADPLERFEEEEFEPSADPGLEFEAAAELRSEWLNDVSLDTRPRDDERELEEELQFGVSYRPSEAFIAFGEISFVAEQEVFADDRPRRSADAFERGEMWLLFRRIFDSGYAVQIGHQSFFEPRLWWWDEEFDALRLYYSGGPWRAYVGLAEQLAPRSSDEDRIEPEEKDVKRLFGYADWRSSNGLNITGFLLYQQDDSERVAVDSVVATAREDESDVDLGWAGLRFVGDVDLGGAGTLLYRADAAAVSGNETLVEFEDDVPGSSVVSGIHEQSVRGWAVDLGLGWVLPFRGGPRLGLNYVYGSGDRDLTDGTDRAFRQTGLIDPDEEFLDYGVVLRPELSNLRIASVRLGVPVYASSRLTLGYHRFHQVYHAPFMRETGLDVEPTGESRDIGEETNLVLRLRSWEDVEIDLIGGSFRAGEAYGASAGNRTRRVFFKFIYDI